MKKIFFSLAILSFLIGGLSILAQSNNLPSSGITPDSPFYFLKSIKETVQVFFTFGADNKAKQYLHLSEVRLAEYQKMIEKGKTDIAQKTLDKYQKQLNQATVKIQELSQKGQDTKDLSQQLENTVKQKEILETTLQKAPESNQETTEEKIEIIKPPEPTENTQEEQPEEAESVCQNECSQSGLKRCYNAGNWGYQTCGDYNKDSCLEWSSTTQCLSNATGCQNGICIQSEQTMPTVQKCSDGTLYGQCSIIKPSYCSNGALINKCSTCGCSTGKTCNTTTGGCATATSTTCSDGTAYNSCSTTKPKYCSSGTLIDKCSVCGCPTGQNCNTTTGSCSTTLTACSDGTAYSACSATTKPKYCSNGTLIDKCSACGCASGKECQSNGSCASPITVIYPNGGEQWEFGKTYDITWTSSGVNNAYVRLYFPDGGVCKLADVSANQGKYSVTLTENQQCANISQTIKAGKYKILILTEKEGMDFQDTSDSFFTIGCPNGICPTATTPSITVTSPNGGEKLEVGKTYTITWKQNLTGVYEAWIDLLKGGVYYKTIAGDDVRIPNAQNITSYSWKVGTVDSSSYYQIRITYNNGNTGQMLTDSSDSFFSITAVSTTCTDSDGGKNYYVKGSCIDKTQSYLDSCLLNTVNEYYCDTSSNTCKNEVFSCPNGCQNGACLPVPSITVTSPNAGEQWTFGSAYNITWTQAGLDNVDIYLEKWADDNGQVYSGGPFTQIIDENISASSGSYSWPLGHLKGGIIASAGNYYKIRIVKTGDTSAYSQQIADSSNNCFSIVALTTYIMVTSPNGGEQWKIGNNYTVTWDSSNMDKLQLALVDSALKICMLNGNNLISETLKSFTFTLNTCLNGSGETVNVSPGNYRMRICGQHEGYPCDYGDSYFNIITTSTTPYVAVVSPNGGENLTESDNFQITWTAENIPSNQNFDITLWREDHANGEIVSGLPSTQRTYNWKVMVPPLSMGTLPKNSTLADLIGDALPIYKIWISTGKIGDYSDNFFAINSTSEPYLDLIYPNNTAQDWYFNDSLNIWWDYRAINTVVIYLQFSDGGMCKLAEVPASQKNYYVTIQENQQCPNIPKTITTGQYKISIWGVVDPSIPDLAAPHDYSGTLNVIANPSNGLGLSDMEKQLASISSAISGLIKQIKNILAR